MLKMFFVPSSAINKDGKIIRGTKLYPYFGQRYKVNEDDIREKISNEPVHYNNATNKNEGKNYYDLLVQDDSGDVYLRNMPVVTNRGYSGESYWAKQNRRDSILDDWEHMPDFSSNNRHMSATLYDQDRLLNNNLGSSKDDAEELIRHYMGVMAAHPFANKYGMLNVPLIVHADEDDLIRAHDIIYNRYDPGRDDAGEIQLKKINKIEQPNSVEFVDTDSSDTAYYDYNARGPNGEPPKKLLININDFFNNDFNIDDNDVWSDARLKSIVDGMYPGYTSYKKYRNDVSRQQNITNGVKEFRQ